MPKETTHAASFAGECDSSYAQVTWRKDDPAGTGFVQVGTFNIEPAPESHDGDRWGWAVTLDRNGLNKLIRDLRRARDQAYGRDE